MIAQPVSAATGSFNSVTAFARYAVFLLLTLVVTLFPVKEAKAESAVDVLLTVCSKVGDMCGPINDLKAVANGCFTKNVDEMACALAILSLGSGGQSQEALKQVNAVAACIKAAPDLADKAKFDALCRPILVAAGVNLTKVDEVYAIAGKCLNADDVDDFIYCADVLMDSSFVEEAELDIPSWVYTAFDLYISIDQKDYWGLVYNVGATVACAVANYYTGNDVCAFLADIAEFAGDVADGAKALGGALNNLGEKAFTDQTKHEPLPDFFNRYWLPEVDAYAQNVAVKQDSKYWDNNIGEKMKHCRNYFDGHTMAPDKACRVCVDMRDGMTATDKCNGKPNITEFPDKGFTQLASRRAAIMLLPGLVKSAAQARISQLRSQGAFKAATLPGPQVQHDPWKGASEVPGVEGFVYRLYGLAVNGNLDEPPMKRDAKTVNEAWRTKTVGYGAYMLAQAAKVAPGTLNFPASEAIAKKSIASGESGIDIAAEVKTFIADAQSSRMKTVEALVGINNGLKDSLEKPLKEALALCIPKATAVCEAEVRERFKACDAKAKAFYDANAAAIGDFDSQRGKNAIKQWGDIRATCEAAVVAYVNALPNVTGNPSSTAACKQFLGRSTELLCTDTVTFNACKAQVDTGKLKTCRLADTTEAYPPSTIVKSCALFLGRTTELLCPNASAYEACKVMVDGGQMKTCRLANTTEVYPKSAASPGTPAATPPAVTPPAATPPAAQACKPFLGRADEMLCSDATAYATCKAQVDAGTMKTCRMTGSQVVYGKLAPAMPPAAPPAAPACKSFLGRADEMLCPDVATFAACKAQVDSGKMKTCRQEGNTAVYSKPAAPAAGTSLTGGGSSLSGGLKPGGASLAPPVPKVDEAALKTCKAFLGRKDEMLCNDARSFAACKTAVDIGQMKTCRITGSTDVYSKR